jgi:hypothetical protein
MSAKAQLRASGFLRQSCFLFLFLYTCGACIPVLPLQIRVNWSLQHTLAGRRILQVLCRAAAATVAF